MIGRRHEAEELNRLYERNHAELVAIYGRRRVGKTYLVDEVFSTRMTFRHAGLAPEDSDARGQLRSQLDHFYNSLLLHGMQPCDKPKTWLDAFFLLEKHLQSIDDGSRQVVFLDELPWLDTPRSGFVRAFEAFWNTWGCHRKNLMVIVCGSANSWVLDRLINNHGGLYNRVTHEMKLAPFTLQECEEFFESIGVGLSRYDIVQSHMIFGGIPYYLGYFDGQKSLAQNVDDLIFAKDSKLRDEFDRLFASVFSAPETAKAIVRILFTRNAGYTRAEISDRLGLADGERLSQNLNALIASDFIVKYVPFGVDGRKVHYKLIDPFCLFYLHFVDGKRIGNTQFWQQNTSSQPIVSWRGIAFENVCFNHLDQIKAALGISGVNTSCSAWSKRADNAEGTQIDMLIVRADNVINMCEIKYSGGDFSVDKNYYKTLLRRQEILASEVSPKITVRSTLITTFGLVNNQYSGAFSNVVTLDDLFA